MKGKLVTINGIDFDEYEVNTGKQIAIIRERIETEIEISESTIEANKQEAYEEYLELKEMKGSNSDEALAAKDAYNLIDTGDMCNCRHDLETEIEILKADGIKLTEALLISEGVWS